jgi:rhodanese-related sulfurtransferase
MDWTYVAVAVVVVVVFLALKRARLVSAKDAHEMLKQGAKVIDVRGPDEFRRDPVRGAVNIPLGDLGSAIARQVPDKATPILVHCLSGGRSEIAAVQLRRAGYARVGNLGSVTRARQVVESARS